MPFVNHEGRNVLFIHIPKTGGTSVEEWMTRRAPLNLWAPSMPPRPLKCTPQHLRQSDLNQMFAPGFFDYAFTIVRHPYDRIASEYRMRHALATASGGDFPRFGLWLEHTLEIAGRNPYHLDNHLRPQWEFVGAGCEVFRFEDGIASVLEKVCARLGWSEPGEIPHKLIGPPFSGAVEWDIPDTIRLRDTYGRDFERFGYDPDRDPAG